MRARSRFTLQYIVAMFLHQSSLNHKLRGYLGDTHIHSYFARTVFLQAPNIMQTDLESAENWTLAPNITYTHWNKHSQDQLGGFHASICYIKQWFKTKSQTCISLLKHNIFHPYFYTHLPYKLQSWFLSRFFWLLNHSLSSDHHVDWLSKWGKSLKYHQSTSPSKNIVS